MTERRARLEATRLYLILTIAGDVAWQTPVADALSSDCIGMVQLRAPGAGEEVLRRHTDVLRPLCLEHGALLLLNDRPDLAVALDLDGAHVGQDDLDPSAARALLGPDRLLGLSTHDEREIEAARRAPVDYLGLGPCHPTGSKRLELVPQGPDLVRRCAASAASLPLFPIGGIDVVRAPALAAAGARRLAVGAGILAADDPAEAAQALDAILRAHGALP